MKNKQPKFSSNSDVKMSCTTKKRLEGTCPEFKNDCGCKEDKNKKFILSANFFFFVDFFFSKSM